MQWYVAILLQKDVLITVTMIGLFWINRILEDLVEESWDQRLEPIFNLTCKFEWVREISEFQ